MRKLIILSAVSVLLVQASGFGRIPLHFIENQGQMDDEVAFYIQGTDKTLYFTPQGVTFALTGNGGDAPRQWIVKLEFVGADPSVKPRGEDRKETIFSYFKGKPEEWKTGIPAYSRLVYQDLWPGIDLVYSGMKSRLKYAFIVKPGADPGKIRLAYQGASNVSIQKTGTLRISTPCGCFEDGIPFAYQVIDGRRQEVSMRYSFEEETVNNACCLGFDLGSFDPAELLILDPELIVYCGFIGGSDEDTGFDIAVDGAGNAYVTGWTQSPETSFPVACGPDLSFNGSIDAFVAKVNAAGTDMEYCGFIGGDAWDMGWGIAVDCKGNAYVTGVTSSTESSFPVKIGPDLTYNSSCHDAFVARINAQGTDLDYCGFLGGAGHDWAYDIAVDGKGRAYVTGETESPESGFPVKAGPDLTHNGSLDAFVARVNATGSGLDYCGYIGGEISEIGMGIAIDGKGSALVTGVTSSPESSFPVKAGPDLTFNGSGDAFVARVNAKGTALDYCGYIGGSEDDGGAGIALDGKGNAFVSGWTSSTESSFPVQVGPDLTHNGYRDAFVAKVNAKGLDLDFCGYIGGDRNDGCAGISLDCKGNIHVTGETGSDESTFPVWMGPDLTHNGGYFDAFAARLDAKGASLVYCGYIGGDDEDSGHSIAVDSQGNAFISGSTGSDASSFPVKGGPDLTYNGGNRDAFIARVMNITFTANTYCLSEATGGTVDFTLDAGQANANRSYIILGSMNGTEPGMLLPGGAATLPLNWDLFTQLVLANVNSVYLTGFKGTLDSSGAGSAHFNTLRPLPPGFAGTTLHFAYALNNPWDFVSNPVGIVIVP